jgi:hypothetical protein
MIIATKILFLAMFAFLVFSIVGGLIEQNLHDVK